MYLFPWLLQGALVHDIHGKVKDVGSSLASWQKVGEVHEKQVVDEVYQHGLEI